MAAFISYSKMDMRVLTLQKTFSSTPAIIIIIIIIIITSTSDLQPSTAIANQLPG